MTHFGISTFMESFQSNIPPEYTSLQDFFLHYHERDVSNSSYSNFPIEPTIKKKFDMPVSKSKKRSDYYEPEWKNKFRPDDLVNPALLQ